MDYISLADRDVSIQMIDFISSVLKVQYNARHEFISPSSVYSIACRGDIFGSIYQVPKGAECGQIHFTGSRYAVSCALQAFAKSVDFVQFFD